MRYTLLICTNEADRPQWGTPAGDAEAKGYDDFHGEVTQRGVFRGGEPLQRVADAQPVVPSLEDGYVLLAQQHSLTAAESAA